MDFIDIFLILILIILFGGAICAWLYDKQIWNGGMCKKTDTRWIRFDMDSQGGRGYHDETQTQRIWISYPVDNKYEEK